MRDKNVTCFVSELVCDSDILFCCVERVNINSVVGLLLIEMLNSSVYDKQYDMLQ